LRLPVLAGIGIVLFLPLIVSGTFMRHDASAATQVARQFLEMIVSEKRVLPELFATPEAPLLAQASAQSTRIYTLLEPHFFYLTATVGPAAVDGNLADVPFTLHFDESAKVTPPIAGPVPVNPELTRAWLEALAKAARRMDGAEGTVHLERSGTRKQWRVRSLTLPPRQGEKTVAKYDFTALTQVPQALPSKVPGFEPLSPVSRAEFEASWQVDLDVREKPALEVLQALVKGFLSPKNLTCPDEARAAASRPVSLRMQRRSRLEAIEEVCRQVGLCPVYQQSDMIALAAGKRSLPCAVAGPFLVQVERVTENHPTATGQMTLLCPAYDVPAGVLALLRPAPLALRDLRVSSADGRVLHDADKQPYHLPRVTSYGSDTYGTRWVIPLKNLLRDLDVIADTCGSFAVTLPSQVEVLRFESLTAGETQSAGNTWVKLTKVDGKDENAPTSITQLEFEGPGVTHKRVQWMALDLQGHRLGDGYAAFDSSGRLRVSLPRQSTACHLRLLTLEEEVVFDFQLRDVPLKGRPPTQLEPARFPGHDVPVTVKVVKLPTGNGNLSEPIRLLVENHTQKEVFGLTLACTYLDADGRPLKETVYTHPRPEAVANAAVMPGPVPNEMATSVFREQKTFTVNVRDPQVPPGAKSVSVAVQRVLFMDATTWPP
jgi:hypothetical protein